MSDAAYPLVVGHEFSGIVEEPAKGGRFAKGARVAVLPLLPFNADLMKGSISL